MNLKDFTFEPLSYQERGRGEVLKELV